jgi:DNA-binding NarL/FixJ family response regulator
MGRGVLVVENDPMTRGLLADLLERQGFDVATAASASDARRVCKVADPDGLVLDIDLGPGPTGFDVADALLSERPHLAILFLTNLPDPRFAGRDPKSLPEGVAYLRKERLAEPGTLVEALDSCLRGAVDSSHRHDLDPTRPMAGLSRTQISVLRLVALGMTNQQIADARGTSVRAVRSAIIRALTAIGSDESEEGSARVVAARSFMLAAGIPLAENA